jgi:putative protease
MGEEIGTVTAISREGVAVRLTDRNIVLNNGDGFSFVAKDGSVCGFRGDVCEGNSIRCKNVPSLFNGARLFRNINAAFEKEIERNRCVREIEATLSLRFEKCDDDWTAIALCQSEDGRKIERKFDAGSQEATNHERMLGMLSVQLGKTAGIYRFVVNDIDCSIGLPFMSASAINGIRRTLAEDLEGMPCIERDLLLRKIEKNVSACGTAQKEISYKFNVSNRISHGVYSAAGAEQIEKAYELSHPVRAELMRTKYCIRYELGMCPVHQKAANTGSLFLLNNGQRFALHFDCRNCEMVVAEANTPQPQK